MSSRTASVAQMVPTMFVRLLKLDDEVRARSDPPCVIVRGAEYAEPSTERERWQGVGRGGETFAWLSTFEALAGTNIRYWLWCRDHRWYVSEAAAPRSVAGGAIWIPLGDVLTKRGRYVVALADT